MKMNEMISRKAAIDALRVAYWDENIQSAKDDPCIVDAIKDWAIRQVKALPSAEPERKKGKWIERWHDNKHVIGDMACSVCGAQMLLTFPRFCPSCGADMRGREEDGN